MRIVWLLAAAALCCGCAGGPVREGTGHAFLSGDVPVRLPVSSMRAQRFQTVRQQQLDFSCGSAALATLLTYHLGDVQQENTVFLGMWNDGDQTLIRRAGFSLLDMKRYLARRGIASDGYSVSLPEIEAAGQPGIALVDVEGYKHFVVLKGVDARTVVIGDPALGLRRMGRKDFEKVWNGVLFVVTPARDQAVVFNGTRDSWLAPSATSRSSLPPPLGTQALALTRPLPGEF
jgi:predicted double-glycine peptidase